MCKARHVTKNHFYSVRSDSPCLPMALPLGATATTAASGGNRENCWGSGQQDATRAKQMLGAATRPWREAPERANSAGTATGRAGNPGPRSSTSGPSFACIWRGRHHTKAGPSHSVLAGRSQPQGKHQLVLIYRPQLHGVFLVRAVRQHQVALPLDGQGDIAAGLLIQQTEAFLRR